MDRRLQELERAAAAGDSEASWRLALERYRSGEWSAGSGEGKAYYQSLQRAGALSGYTFLDARRYECAGLENDVALFTHELTELEFCLIPGGVFRMGSRQDEPEHRHEEGPTHTVTVRAFLMCATPCTQTAWERVTGETPARFKGARRPVEQVSWDDAQSFAGNAGLRLPSEAEWEYACRAGSTSPYCYGKSEAELEHYGVYGSETQGNPGTRDVGSKLPNSFGLYDVHGNVLEWCQDSYADSYTGAPTDGSARAPVDVSKRVCRGGGWGYEAWGCRSATRLGRTPGSRSLFLGFRPARSLP
jgi:formylglycine-generating enzyme required for sulfatase activity